MWFIVCVLICVFFLCVIIAVATDQDHEYGSKGSTIFAGIALPAVMVLGILGGSSLANDPEEIVATQTHSVSDVKLLMGDNEYLVTYDNGGFKETARYGVSYLKVVDGPESVLRFRENRHTDRWTYLWDWSESTNPLLEVPKDKIQLVAQ